MKSSTQVAPELGVESYTYKRSRCLRLSASPFLILQMSLIDSLMVAGVSLCSSRARAAARPLLGSKTESLPQRPSSEDNLLEQVRISRHSSTLHVQHPEECIVLKFAQATHTNYVVERHAAMARGP